MKKRSVQRTMFYNASPTIFKRAEELRNNMTPEEQRLWEYLRKNKLGVRFKAQHPIENFIADFYCHKYKLVIEIDGEIHNLQKEYDIGRDAEMKKYGISIIRFSNEEVNNDLKKVVSKIKDYIENYLAPLGK